MAGSPLRRVVVVAVAVALPALLAWWLWPSEAPGSTSRAHDGGGAERSGSLQVDAASALGVGAPTTGDAASGGVDEHVELRFLRGRSLRGSIVDERGDAVPSADVFMLTGDSTNRKHASRTTDDAGRFLFETLDEGTWSLSVSGAGFASTEFIEVKPGDPDLQVVMRHMGSIAEPHVRRGADPRHDGG